MQQPLDFSNLKANKNDYRVIIYHGSCPDGFCSALSAWYYYKTNGFNMEEFTFVPAFYNGEIPNVNDKSVLICDFSFSYEKTLELIDKTKDLTILDHHLTAENNLAKIPSNYKYFNMKHSGAYLTWAYFFGETNVPDLIKYVEDRDLWNKVLPNTDEISIYLSTLPYVFEEYEKFIDNDNLRTIIPEAIGMVKLNNKYIKNAIKRGEERLIKTPDEKIYRVVFCNSTELQSDIGNKILYEFPMANFSAIYSIYNKSYNFSLRSMNERTDVGTLANKYFNGGGHRNASGCTAYNSNELPSTVTFGRSNLCKLLSSFELEEFNFDKIKTFVMTINLGSERGEVFLDLRSTLLKYLMQIRYGEVKEWQYLCELKYQKKLNDIIILFYKNEDVKTYLFLGFESRSTKNLFDNYCIEVAENFDKFYVSPAYSTIEVKETISSLSTIKNYFI
jgi:oligoribonuclease NrnB/cAMP/cGMP phosphodiesterase (DHH superfamily)